MKHPIILALTAAAFLCAPTLGQSQHLVGVPLFKKPEAQRALLAAGALARSGRTEPAIRGLDGLARVYPEAPRPHLDKAAVLAAAGDRSGALAALRQAAALGAPDITAALARAPLSILAGDPAALALTDGPQPAAKSGGPLLVEGRDAKVTPGASHWRPELGAVMTEFEIGAPKRPTSQAPRRPDEIDQLLRLLQRKNRAAGNRGDLYDNRDDDHSTLDMRRYRQLTRVRYGPEARGANAHYGLPMDILFNQIVIGNSSTAVRGEFNRSLPRYAMTNADALRQMVVRYHHNHLYVFPEHRDHDKPNDEAAKRRRSKGDIYPANQPYMFISQGSSGSDKRILRGLQVALGAMRRDVKAKLKAADQIGPAVQQIFRRAMLPKDDRASYLSGAAHPSVFNGKRIKLERLARIANGMRVDRLPPLAEIKVVRDAVADSRIAPELSETLFDTPQAAARIWRTLEQRRRYVLSAEGSSDLDGRPLTFEWRVLRGDADKVRITPLDDQGLRVEVEIDWHDQIASDDGLAIPSLRIDIGLFADNGVALSAPAFFSLSLPLHQKRVYEGAGPDRRLISIDYKRPKKQAALDPLLWPLRRWVDKFDYDQDGRMIGWTRRYNPKRVERFTGDGLLVLEADANGRPMIAEAVRYTVRPNKKGARQLYSRPTGQRFAYDYVDPAQKIGAPRPLPAKSE